MKQLIRISALIMLVCLAVALTGCMIYSQQKFGAIGNVGITKGRSTVAEVVKQLGAPSFVGKSGSDQILCFAGIDSFQILGVYANVKKMDLVVIADSNGVVKDYQSVNKGEGMSILGAYMAPAFETE